MRVVAHDAARGHCQVRAAQRFGSGVALGHVDSRQLSRPGLSGVRSLSRRAGAARSAGGRRGRGESSSVDGGPRLKEEGFGDLLPGADAIVIDEAHQLPEIAANFLGFAVSSRQLQALSRMLRPNCCFRGAARIAGDIRADAGTTFLPPARRAARTAGAHRVQGVAVVRHRIYRAVAGIAGRIRVVADRSSQGSRGG